MSETSAPTYTIAANLRRFAVVFLFAWTLLALISFGLASIGLDISLAADVGAFAGATTFSGMRFASRRLNWMSVDQHNLALGYACVAFVISAVLAAVITAFDLSTVSDIQDIIAQGEEWLLVVAPLSVLLLDYALARLILHFLNKRGATARSSGMVKDDA